MIERVHEHMISELHQGARTDTIFILTAVVLNLMTLGINSAMASESRDDPVLLTVMLIFVALTVVVNLVAILGLVKGRQTRSTLLMGLLRMYEDQGVAGYYDPSLLGNYDTRYSLFTLAVIITGVISILVPFVVR
jgi:hypothetical protein